MHHFNRGHFPVVSILFLLALLVVRTATAAAAQEEIESTASIETRPQVTFVSLAIEGECLMKLSDYHPVERSENDQMKWDEIDSLEQLPHALADILPGDVADHANTQNKGEKEKKKKATTTLPSFVLSPTAPSGASKNKRYLVILPPSEEQQHQQQPERATTAMRRRRAHMFVDPRYHMFHGNDELDGELVHVTHVAKRETEHLWVPADVSSFDVYCHNMSTRRTFKIPPAWQQSAPASGASQRSFRAQAATPAPGSDIEVETIFASGPPTTQLNVVFLAAGFTAEEKSIFLKNVTALNQMMADPGMNRRSPNQDTEQAIRNMHKSVPFNRYWSFFNVYAVFQPSLDKGASRPLIGLSVRNNLQCQHPPEMERAVFCDRDLALALADVSPARTKTYPTRSVIICIVNTQLYGGSGIHLPGKLFLGNFFNGYDLTNTFQLTKMLSLMDHEIGHALGNLADEYSVGVQEPLDRPLLNCQKGTDIGGPPPLPRWQHWIDIKKANPTGWVSEYNNGMDVLSEGAWDISNVPISVCGFTNYFKPNENCMMHRLNDFFMCPVCREESTISLFKTNFSYAWPRWPLLDTVTLIPKSLPPGVDAATTVNYDSQVMLHLSQVLVTANDFEVVFRDHDGTVLPFDPKPDCPVCVKLNATHFHKYPVNTTVEIRADVIDKTRFISPHKSPELSKYMAQTTVFRLKVVEAVDGLPNVTFTPGTLRGAVGIHEIDRHAAYTQCDAHDASNPMPVCDLNFTSKRYEAPFDMDAAFSSIDIWVFVGLAAIGCLFIFLWAYASTRYKHNEEGIPRPIFDTEFSCFINFIRRIMMASGILFMLAAVASLVMAGYYYTKTDALGKIVIFAGVGLALGMYLMAFLGYWSVSSRSKRLLLVNGAVLLVGVLILVAINYLITTIGKQMSDDNSFWTKKLEEVWVDAVRDAPDRACAIERMLKCSGYITACNRVVGSSLYCPRSCEQTNERYSSPCRTVIRMYIHDNYDTVFMILCLATSLLIGAIFFNFIYYFGLLRVKRELRKQNNLRANRTMSQRCMSPSQAQDTKALYLLMSLNTGDVQKLMGEFKRIDRDGSGTLDRQELAYFFKKALCYKVTQRELDKIFEIGDIDGDGTLSFSEFIAMIQQGSSSSQQDQDQDTTAPMLQSKNSDLMRQRMQQADLMNNDQEMNDLL